MSCDKKLSNILQSDLAKKVNAMIKVKKIDTQDVIGLLNEYFNTEYTD